MGLGSDGLFHSVTWSKTPYLSGTNLANMHPWHPREFSSRVGPPDPAAPERKHATVLAAAQRMFNNPHWPKTTGPAETLSAQKLFWMRHHRGCAAFLMAKTEPVNGGKFSLIVAVSPNCGGSPAEPLSKLAVCTWLSASTAAVIPKHSPHGVWRLAILRLAICDWQVGSSHRCGGNISS